ncbi:hypothetical protein HUA74_21690 [Myxococcus sp. CA051A]|uniref:tetratricopeptide repeat protein n=1 Tax=unclassified Myxococcus TaxID=2648731 RepID=UPI00157A6196|nr:MULTISPECIES: tetratricopeptide repeat protein [unclassified Myxococcus]NTX10479.1 hypothetical protein [Myxococcus sp. CA056]NTX51158.1 hypothetical protein [Myxococcus sp. CA039A]NTX63268.1 hypothetical protein [Myxococcus sp. CA051A]
MEASTNPRSWGAWVVVLWAWLAPGLATANPPDAENSSGLFRHRIERAGTLYESLEYEKALNWLTQAKQVASTTDEQVEVALYRGLVLADLGRRKQALEEFRTGLTLRPLAKLPVAAAPKVERDFESVRKQVQLKQGTESAKAAPVEAPPPVVEEPKAVAPAPVEKQADATPEPKPLPIHESKPGLRSRLGAAGSSLGKNVGSALGSALDTVMGPKDKPATPPPSEQPAAAAKDEP